MLFLLQHDYEHALSFLNHYRDHYSGSDFATSLSIDILLRQGKEQKALQLGLTHTPQWAGYDMLLAYLQHSTPARTRAHGGAAHHGERLFKKALAETGKRELKTERRRRQLFMELLRQHLEERPTAERSPTKLGEAVGLSRATIWRQLRQPRTSNEDELELRSQIQTIALEMRAYGYRPITAELHRRGVKVNHKRVLRLLREDNLLCLRQRAFVRTTDSRHNLMVYPNLTRDLLLSNIKHSRIIYFKDPRSFSHCGRSFVSGIIQTYCVTKNTSHAHLLTCAACSSRTFAL